MKSKIAKVIMILSILSVPVLQIAAEQLELTDLVKNALEKNADIISSSFDVEAESLKYESAKAGSLPSLGFTTDSGNNPLYKYSDSSDPFTSERYQRHSTGGGLNLGVSIPTGGSLSLTGSGSLGFSLAEDASEWEYVVNPAASIFFRQPLFTDRIDGKPLRFDSMKLADELAGLGLVQAEITRTSVENNLIIAIARTSGILNNLRNTYELLTDRLDLAKKRLELALQDEQAGKLSSLDRLSEELQIRRQQEALIELEFQIKSAEMDLEQLTGLNNFSNQNIMLWWKGTDASTEVNPRKSLSVLSSEAVNRSLELAGTVVPNGSEPVLEISGLLRRSDQEEAATFADAFEAAGSAEMDLSLTMSVSFAILDWGETMKKRDAERAALSASGKRLESSRMKSELQTAAAMRNLDLIEEKFELLRRGLEYDESLIKREQLRYEAGLTSELALDTILLDRKNREFQIKQLSDEKALALLQLYNTGGLELRKLF